MEEKFGRDRHRPSGNWVQTTGLLDVVGVQYRRSDALAFASAVREAEHEGLAYGVELEPEPSNPSDPNAIKVIGYALARGFSSAQSRRQWHIGYVPREVARELVEDVVSKGYAFAGELYGIYLGRESNFLDIEFFVLVQRGSPAAMRTVNRQAATAVGPTPPLTDEQQHYVASRQLGLYRNTRLTQAEALKRVGNYEAALDMYLRVLWLDQNGPSNLGILDGTPAFSRDDAFIAPAIMRAVAQGANSLNVNIAVLAERFWECARRETDTLRGIEPIITVADAWSKLESEISSLTASGTRWRKPKTPPNNKIPEQDS